MAEVCTVPIFPLDGVFLCPGLALPLHIFEPRYREMLAHALEGDRRIAMSTPHAGHSTQVELDPPVHEVCGIGEILDHDVFPDGRANVLLRGVSRARILEELPKDQEFRVVRAAVMPELLPDLDLSGDLADLQGSLTRLGATGIEQLDQLSTQQVVDSVLVSVPLAHEIKISLFSEQRVDVRLRRLLENLPSAGLPDIDISEDDPRRN